MSHKNYLFLIPLFPSFNIGYDISNLDKCIEYICFTFFTSSSSSNPNITFTTLECFADIKNRSCFKSQIFLPFKSGSL